VVIMSLVEHKWWEWSRDKAQYRETQHVGV